MYVLSVDLNLDYSGYHKKLQLLIIFKNTSDPLVIMSTQDLSGYGNKPAIFFTTITSKKGL